MYVAVARTETPGPPALVAGRGWHLVATTQPVGILHAVPRIMGMPAAAVALCGVDVQGWVISGPFAPGCNASCQRCGQLVISAEGNEGTATPT